MRSIPNLLPPFWLLQGYDTKEVARKGAKKPKRDFLNFHALLRLCVKLLLTECYNAIELFMAQLRRASNRLHARPPEQLRHRWYQFTT